MTKPIGGYFELELRQGEHYHNTAIRLNTARNCLEYILRSKRYKRVYIPYYTCEVILEPFEALGIDYQFYNIDENLEPTCDVVLKGDEAFLYTNYFGLKQQCAQRLFAKYGQQLIVDNAQAFYAQPIEGVDTIYSARKFFGVPDGAYLYTNAPLDCNIEQDYSSERFAHLIKRIDVGAENGFKDYKDNDNALVNGSLKRMSKLTDALLCNIDYCDAKSKRVENYTYIHNQLAELNKFSIAALPDDKCVPMVYLFSTDDATRLKTHLIENKVFVATYWINSKYSADGDIEKYLINNLIPIPIDQRYSHTQMDKICSIIKSFLAR